MKIDILCSSADHPVNEYLKRWIFEHERDHDISLCREKADLRGGDILFLIHCTEMIDKIHETGSAVAWYSRQRPT